MDTRVSAIFATLALSCGSQACFYSASHDVKADFQNFNSGSASVEVTYTRPYSREVVVYERAKPRMLNGRERSAMRRVFWNSVKVVSA